MVIHILPTYTILHGLSHAGETKHLYPLERLFRGSNERTHLERKRWQGTLNQKSER